MLLPLLLQAPQKIQHPDAVDPSSCNCAKPSSWSPAFASSVCFFGSFGSRTSASALPLNSLASSSGEGASAIRWFQVSPRIGSGNAPPSFLYSSRSFTNRPPMISVSAFASPGGSAPFQCHCSHLPLLTSEPSSSAKQVQGRRKTSVWILAV